MFADLHCHNHIRSFFWMARRRDYFRRKTMYSPWTIVSSNRRAMRKGKRATSYTQADLVKAKNGNLGLTFNALYPIEKPFFQTIGPTIGKDKWIRFLIKMATSHKLPIRDVLQVLYMKIPDIAVDFYQSQKYDYWEELHVELEFVSVAEGKTQRSEIFTPGIIRQIFESERRRRRRFGSEYDATGKYIIPKTQAQLSASLNDESITMLLTIEGAHALGTDNSSIDTILNRIKEIKEKWDYPVFFITLAHHFDNKLCGHAHSLPKIASLIIDQDLNLNGGFSDEGRRAVRRFLSLDQFLNKKESFGYRILIDVKHMSALSRKQYYSEIIEPCILKGDVIPVIASHCGYTGIGTLDELVSNAHKENDNYKDPSGIFNAWNINMCDEDIEMMIKTRGLFGLSFDQRILGLTKADKGSDRNTIKLLWQNIDGIARAVYKNPNIEEAQKSEIWNCISIGTDFEGLIDPVDDYPTALQFKDYARDLIDTIDKARRKKGNNHLKSMTSRAQVEDTVGAITFGNAKRFVLDHFPLN